ncbi:MAG: acyl-CoA dehydrogenase, partial [Pirellulaceae bacterium]
ACLTTTFVITQRTGACQRIERSGNEEIKRRLLPDLIQGKFFATVGISHLTTSRRHLSQPVLRATETGSGFVLDGYSPWVTGGGQARYVVLGATLADGREILVTVPTDSPGVKASPPQPLVGLSASHTGAVVCHQVPVPREWVLAGPIQDVIKQGWGARTGGLQTSTLALGLAESAIRFLETESQRRPEIGHPALALRDEGEELKTALLHAARQQPVCTDAELRTRANSLVLRATQSALGAAKGSGYVAGHPVGRWCREALFFLVWSCPQPVLNANLCEFAGIEG